MTIQISNWQIGFLSVFILFIFCAYKCFQKGPNSSWVGSAILLIFAVLILGIKCAEEYCNHKDYQKYISHLQKLPQQWQSILQTCKQTQPWNKYSCLEIALSQNKTTLPKLSMSDMEWVKDEFHFDWNKLQEFIQWSQ